MGAKRFDRDLPPMAKPPTRRPPSAGKPPFAKRGDASKAYSPVDRGVDLEALERKPHRSKGPLRRGPPKPDPRLDDKAQRRPTRDVATARKPQRPKPKSVVPRSLAAREALKQAELNKVAASNFVIEATAPPKAASGVRAPTGDQTPERIAKVLARAGIASRREAEAMIAEGRVSVNGTVLTTPALTVTPADMIVVDGTPLAAPEMTRLWLFHKPDGLVTTHRDPQGRPTVFESMPPEMPRVISVGRLDLTSEGLLLLTNDGALARTLELPKTGLERTYRARAHGWVTQAKLDTLALGVTVDGVEYGPIVANLEKSDSSNVWIEVKLTEGRNREVRKVLASIGLTVNRLIRTHYGPFKLADLPPSGLEELPMKELRKILGPLMPAQTAGAVMPAPVVVPIDESALPKKKVKRLTGGRGSGGKARMDFLQEEDAIARERATKRPQPTRTARPDKQAQARNDKRGKAGSPLRASPSRAGNRANASIKPPKSTR
jgi:23S rRNA pseudouridine2605 synthase